MRTEPDLSQIAALIGDPARATILSALLGGQSLPASELAYRAHIEPQTTSAHLSKLVDGGLLALNRVGRHRYYRLRNAEVAQALEALAVLAPLPPAKSQKESAQLQALRHARTCYDHLAGKLGVAITQVLLDKAYLTLIDQTYHLTPQGSDWFAAWSINGAQLRKGRRQFACACLDWSERRYHLAGALGAALANKLFEQGWLVRVPGGRAVQLTDAGRAGLKREFAIDTSEFPT